MLTTGALALVAGVLSILSPCVLPLVPIILGTAVAEHRFGPAALALGLALSFTAIGLFVANIGFAIGLDGGVFRLLGAGLMAVLGIVLLAPALQTQLAVAGGPVGDWALRRFGTVDGKGWTGQFLVGLLLGAVWSPCVGPTLGAASVIAAQGRDLPQVALTMGLFGIGAALPLLLLGMLSRGAMMSVRGRLLNAGKRAKQALGALLLGAAIFIATGADKAVETWLVELSPSWLTALTTSV